MDHWKRLSTLPLLVLALLAGCSTPQATPTLAPLPAASIAPTNKPHPTQTLSATSAPEPTRAALPEPTLPAERTIYRDDFSEALGEGWTWLNERSTHWSLGEARGVLRILTPPRENGAVALVRDAPPGDWEISTRVAFEPTENFEGAMLYVEQDDRNWLMFGRAYCDLDWCAGNAIYLDHIQGEDFADDNYATRVESPSLAYLRLRRIEDTFTGYYSQDGEQWTIIGQHTVALGSPRVGLIVRESGKELSADFDFFEIKALSTGAPQPVQTPTQTHTPSPTGTPTRTRTPSPTRTSTPTPCLPHASFVEDVTVPEGTALEVGEPFTKVWRIASDGCAPWPAGSTWAFVSGDRMGAPASVPVPDTPLGSLVDISVGLVAPDASGTYDGNWQMQDPDGTPFGEQADVVVNVKPRPPRRLETGTIIREVGARDGKGQLKIENGLDEDAVAVLSRQEGSLLVAVYILNHSSHTIAGIPDGTYDLYFAVGEDWDAQQATFTRKRRLSRFDDPFPFTTADDAAFRGWSVTLQPVAGGTAGTENVPEGEFPDLE